MAEGTKFAPPTQGKGPANYCGVCGVPMEFCECGKFKERGERATKAGSATADKGPPMKGAGGGEGGGEEKKGGFPAALFGGKKAAEKKKEE